MTVISESTQAADVVILRIEIRSFDLLNQNVRETKNLVANGAMPAHGGI